MFNYRLINNNRDVEDAFLSENMEKLAKDLNAVRHLFITSGYPLENGGEQLLAFLTLALQEIQAGMREQDDVVSTTNSTSPRI